MTHTVCTADATERHLVVTLLGTLEGMNAKAADKIKDTYSQVIERVEAGADVPPDHSLHEFTDHLVDDLIEALTAEAPDNHYFGPHRETRDWGFYPLTKDG